MNTLGVSLESRRSFRRSRASICKTRKEVCVVHGSLYVRVLTSTVLTLLSPLSYVYQRVYILEIIGVWTYMRSTPQTCAHSLCHHRQAKMHLNLTITEA